jgi:double-strand break repair protein MRE11
METWSRTYGILNKQVFGARQHNFTVENYQQPNTSDDNHRVKMPIFMIHGNHDEPVGLKNISALEQLHTNKNINYFGRQNSIEKLDIKPIVFSKGNIQVAVYGLGNMRRDATLNNLLKDQKVKWNRPTDRLGNLIEYFNILVIHQNRYKGAIGVNRKDSVTDETIPNWFNLVLWGHEHESIPRLVPCAETGVEILQPGSTVRTSLINTEQGPKHCFTLTFEQSADDSIDYSL